jgi:hypothetical protein
MAFILPVPLGLVGIILALLCSFLLKAKPALVRISSFLVVVEFLVVIARAY